jgi:anaphase-promoting complex subunit 1
MMALHIVAEDCRLDSSRALDVQRLGQLIVDLASDKGLAFYVDYWWRLFPCRQISRSPISAVDIEPPPPVDGHWLLKAILSGTNVQVALRPLARFTTWGVVNSWRCSGKVSFTPNLDSLIRLYCAAAKDGSGIASNKSSQVVKVMLEEGIDQGRLRRFPWAIAIPMLEAVRQCKDSPPKGLSVNFYTTIGRLDLACHASANKRGLDTDTGRVAAPKVRSRADVNP